MPRQTCFPCFDADGDGAFPDPKNEMAVAAKGAPCRSAAASPVWKKLDTERPTLAFLRETELEAMGKGKRADRMAQHQGKMDGVLCLLDTDKDGKLSDEEMAGRHNPEKDESKS